ncbi:MAG: AAA family ATPase [Acidimicrobiia bacterium]|nr:AAA family ATPase [Acidimicrobiia bacterium]
MGRHRVIDPEILNAVTSYARRGYEIIPLNPNKSPHSELAPHGFRSATTDVAKLTAMWIEHPDLLIGCRVPEDVIILDLDVRYGADRIWDALGGNDIDTRTHYSGRNDGGRHVWLRRPAEDLSTTGLDRWAVDHGLGDKSGIDLLHRDLRYTILPPSRHPETGKAYYWEDETLPIADCPEWLTKLLVERPERAEPRERTDYQGESIFEWFEHRHLWSEILDGWTLVKGDGENPGSLWRHPDATAPHSASVSSDGKNRLYVYSPNTPLPTETGISKFDAYALMGHGGDEARALEAMRELPGAPSTSAPVDLIEWGGPKLYDEKREKGSRFSILSAREILELDPPDWIIDDIIEKDSLAVLYGASGSGKSWLAIDWALSIASGRDFFSHSTSRGKVLYCIGEGAAGIPQRQMAWLDHRGLELDDIEGMFWLNGSENLMDDGTFRALLKEVGERSPDLIVIDTLARYTLMDENNASDMQRFVDRLDDLRRVTGACVLVVHHSGKEVERGARGSTALRASVDTELGLSEDEGTITLKATKQKNSALTGDAVRMRLRSFGDGAVLVSALVLDDEEETPVASGGSAERVDQIILRLLAERQSAGEEAVSSTREIKNVLEDVGVLIDQGMINGSMALLSDAGLVARVGHPTMGKYEVTDAGYRELT